MTPVKFNEETKRFAIAKINENDLVDGIKDSYYHHTQTIAAAIWNVEHNFGRLPNLRVFGEDGKEILRAPNHIIETDGITCNRSEYIFDTLLTGIVICT